ncbi:MAG TPA: LmeA family phospholipid-binding protein, partial [Microbacterium sp.]|uniref:LmeA family phospholipid-binding protein n=1 Tax=Microbacterium sp. TaxID=51671 RepID=UPI002B487B75
APAAPKRRRHRALIVALSTTAVVLVAVGIAAAIGWQVAETQASSAVKQTVQQKVDQVFGLPASHPVAVSFQEPVLPQVWAGKLATLNITVADVPIAGTKGTVKVHATQVPTGGTGKPKSLDVSVRLRAGALRSIVSANRTALGQILPGSVKVDGTDVTVALNPGQFLSGVSFSEVLGVSVKDGALVLTPKKFVVGGLPMSADTVRARFGGLAQGILASRTICLADGYPSGMTLTGLEVKPTGVLADFDVDRGILSDPALQARGTCK